MGADRDAGVTADAGGAGPAARVTADAAGLARFCAGASGCDAVAGFSRSLRVKLADQLPNACAGVGGRNQLATHPLR